MYENVLYENVLHCVAKSCAAFLKNSGAGRNSHKSSRRLKELHGHPVPQNEFALDGPAPNSSTSLNASTSSSSGANNSSSTLFTSDPFELLTYEEVAPVPSFAFK